MAMTGSPASLDPIERRHLSLGHLQASKLHTGTGDLMLLGAVAGCPTTDGRKQDVGGRVSRPGCGRAMMSSCLS